MSNCLFLELKSATKVPINVRGVLPEKVTDLSQREIADLPIWYGKRQLPLGDLFCVSSGESVPIVEFEEDPLAQIIWKGDLGSVHWLGADMQSGQMLVEGDAGRHLGSQMSGGRISVRGSVSDWAGCEMSGGRILISKNAGDWLGAAYPGSKVGTNRGTIAVGGDAGNGVGFSMRRGWISVAGSVQRLAGWNVLAGTIVVGHAIGPMAGKGMVRGSLILPSVDYAIQNRAALPPSFSPGLVLDQPVIALARKWLRRTGFEIPAGREFQMFHGDQLTGGRGEVLIATDTKNVNQA